MSHGVRLFLIIGLSQRKSRFINLKKIQILVSIVRHL